MRRYRSHGRVIDNKLSDESNIRPSDSHSNILRTIEPSISAELCYPSCNRIKPFIIRQKLRLYYKQYILYYLLGNRYKTNLGHMQMFLATRFAYAIHGSLDRFGKFEGIPRYVPMIIREKRHI